MSNRWPDMFFSDKSLGQAPHRVSPQAKKVAEQTARVPAPKPPSEPTPPPSTGLPKPATAAAGAWPNMFFGDQPPRATASPVGLATPPPSASGTAVASAGVLGAAGTTGVALTEKSEKGDPRPDPFDTVAFEQFLDKGKKQQVMDRKAEAGKIQLPGQREATDESSLRPTSLPETPVVPVPAEIDETVPGLPESEEPLPFSTAPGPEPEAFRPAEIEAEAAPPPPDEAEPDQAGAPMALHADTPTVPGINEAEDEPPEPEDAFVQDEPDVDVVEDFNEETLERAKVKGYEPMTLPPPPPGMDVPKPVPRPPEGGDEAEPVEKIEAAPPAPADQPSAKDSPETPAESLPDLPPGVDAFSLGDEPAEDDESAKAEETPEVLPVEAGDDASAGKDEPVVSEVSAAAPLAPAMPGPGLDPEEGAKEFTLTNGELISGKVLSETDTELFVQTLTLGIVTLKRDHLAKKLMEVVLLNGDRVTGEVVAENKDFIYLRNASLGTLTIPRDQGARNVVEVELANGNRIVGELVVETEDVVLIKSATLGTVSVDRKGMRHLAQRVEQSQIKSLM